MDALQSEVTVRRGDRRTGRFCLVSVTAAQAEIFEGYPDAIVCRIADKQAVVYISVFYDDGSAVYEALDKEGPRK